MGRAVPSELAHRIRPAHRALRLLLPAAIRDPLGGGFLNNYISSPAKRYEKAARAASRSRTSPAWRTPRANCTEIVEFLKDPGEVHAARRAGAQGRAAGRPAGHRQDAAGPGRRRRGGRAVLLHQRLRVHPDVRRRRRQPRPRHVQDRQGELARASSSSTRSTPSAGCAAPASAAAPTSASRRSTRSSARWTASSRPRRSS